MPRDTAPLPPSPAPEQVRALRQAAGLTQAEAAEYVSVRLNSFQRYEYGKNAMPPGLWELFRIKTGQP